MFLQVNTGTLGFTGFPEQKIYYFIIIYIYTHAFLSDNTSSISEKLEPERFGKNTAYVIIRLSNSLPINFLFF